MNVSMHDTKLVGYRIGHAGGLHGVLTVADNQYKSQANIFLSSSDDARKIAAELNRMADELDRYTPTIREVV